jgi:hypothetical protein
LRSLLISLGSVLVLDVRALVQHERSFKMHVLEKWYLITGLLLLSGVLLAAYLLLRMQWNVCVRYRSGSVA